LFSGCFISVNAGSAHGCAPNIVATVSAGHGMASARARKRVRLKRIDRVADRSLRGLCIVASVTIAVLMADIGYQLLHGGDLAISKYGLSFLAHSDWKPNFDVYGAGSLLYGTVVTSLMGLLIATPIGISIGLFLSLLAPRAVRAVVGPLVEMLAAIPSVILGFWGILVLAPFLHGHVEPWLHDTLGSGLPIFGTVPSTGLSVFTAGLILTIMIVPIIASVSRDLFLTVPRELQDGAAALGATRWEIVRGVVLPSTASGVASAACLGLGRALGEAIAVTQVIGAGNEVHASLFENGDTLASRIANQFQGATDELHTSSLFYLALILLAVGLATNLLAQWIARRFDVRRLQTR
jgi:phosphate transport system permease protein